MVHSELLSSDAHAPNPSVAKTDRIPERQATVIPAIEHKWRFREGKFLNTREQWLYYCSYFPSAGTPLRGVVLFLHGIGEYSRRFAHVFDVLCASGFGVIAYDLVAHGRSECETVGARAHALGFQHFVDDTNTFLDFAHQSILPPVVGAEAAAALPLVLMGMSYGTLVGLHTVLSERHAVAAIVLAAPAVSVEWTRELQFQALFMRPIAMLFPWVRITPGVNYAYLSRDPSFVQDFLSDPLIVTEKLTARMASETLDAMNEIQNDARIDDAESALCRVPILILQGTNDKITSLALAEHFYDRLATADKEFKKFEGLYHCIFNEPEKDAVTDHILAWLQQRFPVTKYASSTSSSS
ncbi:hypothetical protein ATCC90586_004409 [Pythium insidiosum]|nr:hypothetical protein ATCC90586_004409 [Pythium insidiosum]